MLRYWAAITRVAKGGGELGGRLHRTLAVSRQFTHFNVAQTAQLVKLLEIRTIDHVMLFVLLIIEGNLPEYKFGNARAT